MHAGRACLRGSGGHRLRRHRIGAGRRRRGLRRHGGILRCRECIDCTPNCVGKACGDDGCGGSCGDCGDGNPCTADQCFNGICAHSDIENCCLSDDECVDEDKCTDDTCTGNVCWHLDICCQTHEECLNEDECTYDFCSASEFCAHKPTNGQGCCPKYGLWEGFEDGDLSAAQNVASPYTAHPWSVVTDQAHSGSHSAMGWTAGLENDTAILGYPGLTIPPTGGTLSFWVKGESMGTSQAACQPSHPRFEARVNGYPAFQWCYNGSDWQQQVLDLAAWAGQEVSVDFVTTRGTNGNSGGGPRFWLDDIEMNVNCP